MVQVQRIPQYTGEDLGQAVKLWYLFFILFLLSCLFPMSLLAQSFDLERLRRSVVRIISEPGHSTGSGAILKVDGRTGYILTAYHVIIQAVDAGQPFVKVEIYPNYGLEARLSQSRVVVNNDVAVLTVENLPVPLPPAIPWGDSDAVRETHRVFALGHPQGGPLWAVTDGFVSSIQAGKIYFSGTAVAQGNSGGPLLDAQGALVGMNMSLSDNLGSALAWNVIRQLIRGWPGLDKESDPLPGERQLPAYLYGKWKGQAQGPLGPKLPITIELTFRPNDYQQSQTDMSYCTLRLEFLTKDEHSVTFKEHLIQGRCTTGEVTLSKTGDLSLKYLSRDNYGFVVSGTLNKIKE